MYRVVATYCVVVAFVAASTEIYDVTTVYHVGEIYKNTTDEGTAEVHLLSNARGLPVRYDGIVLDKPITERQFPTCDSKTCPWVTKGWDWVMRDSVIYPDSLSEKKYLKHFDLASELAVTLKGYMSTDLVLPLFLYSQTSKLLRDLSRFYVVYFASWNAYNHVYLCQDHLSEVKIFTDFDGVSFGARCRFLERQGDMKWSCGDENAVNYLLAKFTSERFLFWSDYKKNIIKFDWNISPPIDINYLSMSLPTGVNGTIQSAVLKPTATQSLTSPWFTASTNKLCLAMIVRGRAVLNITVENIQLKIYCALNSHLLGKPIIDSVKNVTHFTATIPEELRAGKIRLKLYFEDTSSDFAVERISSCTDEGETLILNKDYKETEEGSKPVFDVTVRYDVGWCLSNPNTTAVANGGCKLESATVCPPGFKGDGCETDVDWCLSNPNATAVANGSYKLESATVCPPGFKGDGCETACGRNAFGQDCKGVCSKHTEECQGLQLCTTAFGCQCAPGYHGSTCEETCDAGSYGNNCKQKCGHCLDQSACDIYTGHCGLCAPGYYLPYCKDTYPVVTIAPDVSSTIFSEGIVKYHLNQYSGRGQPVMYQLQYRKSKVSNEWIAFEADEIPTRDLNKEEPITLPQQQSTLEGLDDGVTYDVRVILFTEYLDSYQGEDVPYTTFLALRTAPGPVKALTIRQSDKSLVEISWSAPDNVGSKKIDYHIYYQCIKSVSCNRACRPEDSDEIVVACTNETLYSLLPFTIYHISVSAGGENVTRVFGTKPAEPTEVVSEATPAFLATNTSVTVYWTPVDVCSGFFKGYVYQVYKPDKILGQNMIKEAITRKPQFSLDQLPPQTEYFAHIFIKTVAGTKPDKYLRINFSTSGTVPEQVVNLTVYKRGRNLLGLRWAKPVKLYDELASFTVSYDNTSLTVPPTPCAAWPDLYCYTVDNLRPNRQYTVNVSARNNELSQDGTPTSVTGVTKESIPGTPEDFQVDNSTSTTFALSWKYPMLANGIVRSFLLSVEETEQFDSDSCCQIYPIHEEVVMKELAKYVIGLSGLHPASTYTVSLSAKTVSIGPSVTLTVYTRPPPMPVTLPAVTVDSEPPLVWLRQAEVNDSHHVYKPLIKGRMLLVVLNNGESQDFDTGIHDEQLKVELNKQIPSDFYLAAEYFDADPVTIGAGENKETQWGLSNNSSLTSGETYKLAAVQVSEYCGVINVDTVLTETFTAQ